MYPSINSLLLQISLSYFPHNQTFNPWGCRWKLNCFWFPSSLSQRHLLKPTDSLICVLHPSTPLYWTGVDDSELYHKLGHATYIQNEITPMWRRAKKENTERVVHRNGRSFLRRVLPLCQPPLMQASGGRWLFRGSLLVGLLPDCHTAPAHHWGLRLRAPGAETPACCSSCFMDFLL